MNFTALLRRVVAPVVGLRPLLRNDPTLAHYRNQPAGDPLIEGETLSRPSRPPLLPALTATASW